MSVTRILGLGKGFGTLVGVCVALDTLPFPSCQPQWTTDQQLIQVIRSIGVYDVVELKFAENRANGQSKG